MLALNFNKSIHRGRFQADGSGYKVVTLRVREWRRASGDIISERANVIALNNSPGGLV